MFQKGGNIWPIFNVADISVNIGVALAIIYNLFFDENKKTIETTKETPENG